MIYGRKRVRVCQDDFSLNSGSTKKFNKFSGCRLDLGSKILT